MKLYNIKSATGHMFVLALSYCNCTALLGAAPNLILRRTQLVQRKPFWSWLSWNLTVSNLDNLPAQATERKLTRLLLLFNPSPCTDLVACVTGVRKARERAFGALINMAKGARGREAVLLPYLPPFSHTLPNSKVIQASVHVHLMLLSKVH